MSRLHLLVTFDPKEVGRRIARARERRGWTQLQFALEAHVSPSSVSRWERGLLPPVRELMRLAEILGIDVSELVEERPEPGSIDERDAAIHARFDRLEAMIADLRAAADEDDPPMPRAASA